MDVENELHYLRAVNKELITALNFYADERNWRFPLCTPQDDHGRTARRALTIIRREKTVSRERDRAKTAEAAVALQRIRRSTGLTQVRFAEKIGVSKGALCYAEHNQRNPLPCLKLAELYLARNVTMRRKR